MVGSSAVQQLVSLSNFLQFDMTGKVILSVCKNSTPNFLFFSNQIQKNIAFPVGHPNEFFKTYKVMTRHVNSHAIINAAFSVLVDSNMRVVEQPLIAYGGIQVLPFEFPQLRLI